MAGLGDWIYNNIYKKVGLNRDADESAFGREADKASANAKKKKAAKLLNNDPGIKVKRVIYPKPAPAAKSSGGNPMLSAASGMPTPAAFPSFGPAPQIGAVAPEFGQAVRDAFPQAMSMIEDKYRRAIEEVGRREHSGNQLLDALPAQYEQTFGTAQTDLSNSANALAAVAAQQMPNLDPERGMGVAQLGMTGQEGVTPFQGALTTLQAEHVADVPLLRSGQGQFFGGQRSMLDASRMQELQELQAQQAEIMAQMDMERARMGQERELANARMQADRESAIFGAQADMSARQQNALYDAQLEKSMKEGSSAGGLGISPDRGRQALETKGLPYFQKKQTWGAALGKIQELVNTGAMEMPDAVNAVVLQYAKYPETMSALLAFLGM